MRGLLILLIFTIILTACSDKPLTPEQQKGNEISKVGYELANFIEQKGKESGVLKWKKLTVYETSTGGFIYYLGTNSLNGLQYYWNGDLANQKIQALDPYSSKQMGNVKLYEGKDKDLILKEWRESEKAKNLDKLGLEPFLK